MKKKEQKDWRDEWMKNTLNGLPKNICETHLFIVGSVIEVFAKQILKAKY